MRAKVVLLVLACALSGAILAAQYLQAGGVVVFSVADVQHGLHTRPALWVGRTLLVRGKVVSAIPCIGDRACSALAPGLWQQNSVAPAMPMAVEPLSLAHTGLTPWFARLRGVPILGGLLPAPQTLRFGAVATYRVQLRARARSICGAGICFEAALVDPAR
jgi:hypothetical protein